jgi:hypothetical protein
VIVRRRDPDHHAAAPLVPARCTGTPEDRRAARPSCIPPPASRIRTEGRLEGQPCPHQVRDPDADTCSRHRQPRSFTFDQWDQAYDTFSRAADEEALKVVISSEG